MTQAAQFNTTSEWRSKGYHLRTAPLVLVAYDPAGDGDDRDALVMISREELQRGETWDPDFAVMMLFRVLMAHRMRPDLEFPDKEAMLLKLHRQLVGWKRVGRASDHVFCVETNGVGYAMASSLRSNIRHNVIGYTTVGSTSDKPFAEKKVSMPRLAALDNLRVLAETHQLKVAKDAPGRKHVIEEMSSFVWRAPGRPEAMEGQRDDIVMAMAGACWMGTRIIPPLLKQTRVSTKGVH
jgi:hypothetical protein